MPFFFNNASALFLFPVLLFTVVACTVNPNLRNPSNVAVEGPIQRTVVLDDAAEKGERLILRLSAEQMASLPDRLAQSGMGNSLIYPLALSSYMQASSGEGLVILVLKRMETGTEVMQTLKDWGMTNVGRDGRVQISQVPNDPYWSTGGAPQSGDLDAIHMREGWDRFTGSPSTVVAVVDTGIDFTHPDLQSNLWVNEAEANGLSGVDDDRNGFVDDIHGYNFIANNGNAQDDHNHGTHVAGTIGATANNRIGIAGINWSVKMMAIKVLGADGFGYWSGIILGLNYAVAMKARISNFSLGGNSGDPNLSLAVTAARDADHLIVAAAMNNSANNDSSPAYPANYPQENIISVAATDNFDHLAYFSNYGLNSVDLGAPGVNIMSTVRGGYAVYNGTSMAAPHVTGVAALLEGYSPNASYLQLRRRLLSTVDPVSDLTNRVQTGGRLNAASALALGGFGAIVKNAAPQSETPGAVNGLALTFNKDLKIDGFKKEAIHSFIGPDQTDLASFVTSVTGSGKAWTVHFSVQTKAGDYSMKLGPDIQEAKLGVNLDQNEDGLSTDADFYLATFRIAQSQPTATPTQTQSPTVAPTLAPTATPTVAPTAAPTIAPTAAPTIAPTAAPTIAPTAAPTIAPTVAPTKAPTAAPTKAPTAAPTIAPTAVPTAAPTAAPTSAPTAVPTVAPTSAPFVPTSAPTAAPTVAPTVAPTAVPTVAPTAAPTDMPPPAACNVPALSSPLFDPPASSIAKPSGENLSATLNTAPTGFSVTPINAVQVRVAWGPYNKGQTGFEIQHGTDGVSFPQSTTSAPNSGGLVHSGLTAGSTVYYRIRAFDSAGYSAFSPVASVKLAAERTRLAFQNTTTRLSTSFEYANNVFNGLHGKTFVVGSIYLPGVTSHATLLRYNEDLTLDGCFGNGGAVVVDSLPSSESGAGVVQLADGRILFLINGGNYAVVARYFYNGQLDTSFGNAGYAKFYGISGSTAASMSYPIDMRLVAGGKILVGGYVQLSGRIRPALWRLTSSGQLDTTFAQWGNVIPAPLSGVDTFAYSMDVGPNGEIYAAGMVYTATPHGFVLKFSASGAADGTFGAGGVLDVPSVVSFTKIKVQADGKPAAIGSNKMWRYLPNGTPDTTFGLSGVSVDLTKPNTANALRLKTFDITSSGQFVLGGDGNTVLAGYETDYDYALVRLTPSGAVDRTFGVDGLGLFAPRKSLSEIAWNIAVAPNGSYLAVGSPLDPWGSDPDHNLISVNPNVRAAGLDTTNAASPAVSVAGGDTCVLNRAGKVLCSGNNFYGQLGNNDKTESWTAVPVQGVGGIGLLSDVTKISVGGSFHCALNASGNVLCWGDNANGKLGNGTATSSSVPVKVLGVGGAGYLENIVDISTGGQFACALSAAGNVYCWGQNYQGSLGNAGANSSTPVAVVGVNGTGMLSNITQISVIELYGACALSASGEVYCWGYNDYGMLGRGTVGGSYPSPAKVVGIGGLGFLSNIRSISSGYSQTCALTYTGEVACWGSYNLASSNPVTFSEKPVAVAGIGNTGPLTGVRSISAGKWHACAVTEADQALCWGSNYSWQLGTGDRVDSASAVQVKGVGGSGTLGNVQNVETGSLHTCAVMKDMRVTCWGDNYNGPFSTYGNVRVLTPVYMSTPYGYGFMGL